MVTDSNEYSETYIILFQQAEISRDGKSIRLNKSRLILLQNDKSQTLFL